MKKLIIFLKKGVLYTLFISVIACNKSDNQQTEELNQIQEEIPVVVNPTIEGEELILGKKLENPYSLENMQKAADIIANSPEKDKLPATKLKPTHIYVVFLPENDTHLQLLREIVESKKIVCREHPIDYEIIQHGAIYTDSRTKNPEFPVLYASIPIDEKIPDVPYEKLEDLFLPDEQNDPAEVLEVSSLYLAQDLSNYKLQEGYPRLSAMQREISLEEKLKDVQALFGIFNKRYYPEGVVRVQNSNGKFEPLQNAEIQIYNWFFQSYCYTDKNGYFKSRERFRREMGVYATWDSNSVKISTAWNEILGIRRSDKLGNISRGNNGRNFDISNTDHHKWRKATVHNAVQIFNFYVTTRDLKQEIRREHIWVFNGKSHTGAAPMIETFGPSVYTPTILSLNGWGTFLGMDIVVKTTLFARKSFPDVVINVHKYTTDAVYQLTFHELAHVIHAKQVGSWYWGEFISETLNNIQNLSDPYGNGIQPHKKGGQRIALCEGWAVFMEHRLSGYAKGVGHSLERFTMYSIPSRYVNDDSKIDTNKSLEAEPVKGWFLHGFLYDLLDWNNDYVLFVDGQTGETISNNIMDDVTLDLNRVFYTLRSNVKSGFDLKEELKIIYPQQSSQIENLFNAYGY